MSPRRPSGVPEQDLCSFVTPYYLKQKAYLGRELKKILQENAVLAQRVQAGREGIAQTEQRIATAVDEWKVSKMESCTSPLTCIWNESVRFGFGLAVLCFHCFFLSTCISRHLHRQLLPSSKRSLPPSALLRPLMFNPE